jgi:lysozyme
MKLVILLGVATSIYPAEFLYRDINQPEFEIPNVLEVLRAEVEEKFVDQPILIRPKAVLVKPNINWNNQMVVGVKFFEGYKERAYICAGGVRTIGYGCTDTKVVSVGKISKISADNLLREHLAEVREKVANNVSVQLTEYQLNALTSFAFNCGMTNLKRLVEGEGRLNSGNYESVEKLLPQYRIAGGKVRKGLEKRRKWELSLWKGNLVY